MNENEQRQQKDKEQLNDMMNGKNGAWDPYELDVNDKESLSQLIEMGQVAQRILGRMW